ncbi:MAG TPA: hypothetical protein VFJ87_09695 [Rhodanobacteraceae bacterium]|nr:hypothetical protein [Rhodanobacteraceae bacterium]
MTELLGRNTACYSPLPPAPRSSNKQHATDENNHGTNDKPCLRPERTPCGLTGEEARACMSG